jgi:Carboxypeptidase regulatory-like domain
MRVRLLRRIFITLLLLVGAASNLKAQTTASGGLTGTVTDPSNHFVAGAIVELKNTAKGTLQSTKTDAEGAYVFSYLLPGSYTLRVSHPGFTTEIVPLNVLLGPPGTLHVKMVIAPVATTIQVKTGAPLINTDNGDASMTITERQVSELPNPGNDLTYLAQTAPGVVMNTDQVGPEITLGNFSSLGKPGYSNLFTVNGMNSNDMGFSVNMTGASFLFLGQNQIEEATVVSNGYSGQFGLFAGANVNYITKSGGNVLHGNAVYYWNGRAFNANNWFNNANGLPRPFDNANQWAASLGGPIKKDKLFFFLNTEGLELLIPSPPTRVVLPSAQFQSATIANIDSIFGTSSASDAFYKQMFNLYNNAPGAGRATPGVPGDPLGCGGFQGPNGLGTTVPCATSFESTLSNQPTHEFLTSGRVDWNIGSKDRAFLLAQYECWSAAYIYRRDQSRIQCDE